MLSFSPVIILTYSVIISVLSLFCVFSVGFAVISMNQIKDELLKGEKEAILADYDENIKNQVQNAISMLDYYNQQIQAGTLSKEEGMKQAADCLRGLKYGEEGYFWADYSDGTNVFSIPIGEFGSSIVNYLGGSTVPLIMISLGLSLNLRGFKRHFKEVSLASIIKLSLSYNNLILSSIFSF